MLGSWLRNVMILRFQTDIGCGRVANGVDLDETYS